jgi:hypothetical protein
MGLPAALTDSTIPGFRLADKYGFGFLGWNVADKKPWFGNLSRLYYS